MGVKYESSIHNIDFLQRKRSLVLNQERNLHRLSTVYKLKQPETVLQKYVDFDVKGQLEMDSFTGGSIIMDYGLFSILARSDGLKLLCINNGFVSNKQAALHFTCC